MAWIELREHKRWWRRSWRLVDLDIYQEIRWLSSSNGYIIWGIPYERERGETKEDWNEWDNLYECETLRQCLREFRRIKRRLQR